jgi:hypothetical protein
MRESARLPEPSQKRLLAEHSFGTRFITRSHHGALTEVPEPLGTLGGKEVTMISLASFDPAATGNFEPLSSSPVGLHDIAFVSHETASFVVSSNRWVVPTSSSCR